jgi:hypothetical protein
LRPHGHTFAAVLTLVLVLGLTGVAHAQTVVPVRGGAVLVPPFDSHHYHDSDSCQAALNAALGDLSNQLGSIPFPPPGQPGYHEWANAIGAEMSKLNAQRSHCLSLGAPGRTASPQEARRFAGAAEQRARRFVRVSKTITKSRGKPARTESLAEKLLSAALGLAGRFDLEALKNAQTWRQSRSLGVDLRKGQLKQLPGFAAGLQNVADYDHEVVAITEARAKTDAELAFRMNLLSQQQYQGRPYDQLYPEERRAIVSQVARESGALQNLISRVKAAARAGLGVIFGR